MNKFISNYLDNTKNLLNECVVNYTKEILEIQKKFKNCSKKNKKIIFIGNGGSAATSSHVSVDLTKNAKIRAINFNEADLITCFSNDYGYSEWMKKGLEFYLDKNDIVVLISTSGKSPNIIKAAKYLKKKSIELITFTGMKKKKSIKILKS